MATLTIQVSSGESKVLTYSGPDAQRIFNAWKLRMTSRPGPVQPPANLTVQDFVDWLGTRMVTEFKSWVDQAETIITKPTPPDIT